MKKIQIFRKEGYKKKRIKKIEKRKKDRNVFPKTFMHILEHEQK